jgi:hypothetical protein
MSGATVSRLRGSGLTGLILLALSQTSALGQAVSAPNAKLEFDAGSFYAPPSSGYVRAAGSLTIPLSHQFGIQGDLMLASGGNASASGALHVFTRDPAAHLLGGTLGFVRTAGATIYAAGPEAEIYRDRLSLEAWGGVAAIDNDVGPDSTGAFIMAVLAYYPDDNWRVAGGVSVLGGVGALHLSSEYLMSSRGLPVSIGFDARVASDGSTSVSLGLKSYFSPVQKSLLSRHREDDPQNRGADLARAAPPIDPTAYSGPECLGIGMFPNPITDVCEPIPS